MSKAVIRGYLTENEIEYDEIADGVFSFSLPGEKGGFG